jgi:Oxidoreductase family, NAD-binding Rossmann fold
LIGARRVRHGLGPFVARHLVALGAEVPCFLATRPESIAQSERELGARGYLDLGDLLARETPDALAILSPSETHERYLAAALEARVHVLCEKPLLWTGAGLARRAATLCQGFAAAGLLLRESCQWPYTLDGYRALHPDVGPLERFAMRLSPAAREPRQMLGDALPHPLSLLQALTAGAEAHVEDVAIRGGPGEVELGFFYVVGGSAVRCEITLRSSDRPPREAAYAVNGRWAERRIRPADYAFSLGAGGREVSLPDPLRELLRDFLAALPARGGAGQPEPAIPARMAFLEQILAALPASQE